jgi:diguanylate cyclase (GGDEF)-like protein
MPVDDLDQETGAFSYRYLRQRLTEEIKRSKRYGKPFSLVLLDIDKLRIPPPPARYLNWEISCNVILKETTKVLKKNVRDVDVVCRGSSCSFIILLPEVDKEGGRVSCERIRKAINHHVFPRDAIKFIKKVTVSIGLATFPEDGEEEIKLCKIAQRALDCAKEVGDKVCFHKG